MIKHANTTACAPVENGKAHLQQVSGLTASQLTELRFLALHHCVLFLRTRPHGTGNCHFGEATGSMLNELHLQSCLLWSDDLCIQCACGSEQKPADLSKLPSYSYPTLYHGTGFRILPRDNQYAGLETGTWSWRLECQLLCTTHSFRVIMQQCR